ncbi:MAG: DUF4145 domain-containing protein [Spirochaetales bacterium]|nr:DUF4145 domain-containing protein [Spirochaetales bacterium]
MFEYRDDYSKGKIIKSYCNKCQKEMNQTVVKSIKEIYEENNEYGVSGSSDYQILKCLGCDSISFQKDCYFSEYRDYDSNGCWVEKYPTSNQNNYKLKEFDDLPFNIIPLYEEVIDSFNNSNFILCAAGIRAILEGICKDKNIKKGEIEVENKNCEIKIKKSTQLFGRIKGLVQAGIITKKHEEALQELRFLGNESLHEITIPKKKHLLIAIEIIEHMIIDIYDLPLKFEKLKNEREKKMNV